MSFGAAPISFVFQVQGSEQAKQQIQSVGGAFSQFGSTAQATSAQTQVVTRDFKMAALGASAAASSAVSLYFQYDNLRKGELAVDKAQKNLTSAQASATSAQNTLNKMIADGTAAGPEYEAAVLRASAADQQLAIAKERVSLSQGDLTQQQMGFALQVVPTVISAVASVAMAASAMGVTLTGTSIATGLASIGMKGFALAIRLAQLAMGPIGLILIGIGTVLTLIATNAFGVRDAINAMGKAIGDALPFLKPVMEFFGAVGKALFGETDEMKAASAPTAAPPAFAQAGENYAGTVSNSIMAGGSGGGGGGNISVKVYVDGKEIASRIKISTAGKM